MPKSVAPRRILEGSDLTIYGSDCTVRMVDLTLSSNRTMKDRKTQCHSVFLIRFGPIWSFWSKYRFKRSLFWSFYWSIIGRLIDQLLIDFSSIDELSLVLMNQVDESWDLKCQKRTSRMSRTVHRSHVDDVVKLLFFTIVFDRFFYKKWLGSENLRSSSNLWETRRW